MEYLSLDIPFYAYVCLGVAAVAILFVVTAGLHKARTVGELLKPAPDVAEQQPDPEEKPRLPRAMVVVYGFTTGEELDRYLDALDNQDYPDYETVLVYDACAEAAACLAEKYADRYSNLYITFVPQGSHNISRRKLALTIGIKAREADVVVTTTSNCSIPSRSWLSSMMAPFAEEGKDVVLGYSRIDFSSFSGMKRLYRQYDFAMTAVQWLGSALNGHPYRGDGANLAFRRRFFVENRGYSATNKLETGDDDIFVNEIATGDNTAVVVTPDTILTTEWGDSTKRMWIDIKERYAFTAKWLPKAPFRMAGLTSALRWTALAALAGASAYGLPSLIPAIAATVLLCLWFTFETLAFRKAATALRQERPGLLTPLFALWRPIGNLIFKIVHWRDRYKNFTYIRRL